jgi:hypothetical protein
MCKTPPPTTAGKASTATIMAAIAPTPRPEQKTREINSMLHLNINCRAAKLNVHTFIWFHFDGDVGVAVVVDDVELPRRIKVLLGHLSDEPRILRNNSTLHKKNAFLVKELKN